MRRNSDASRFLFIGGPLDGQFVLVHVDAEQFHHPVDRDPPKEGAPVPLMQHMTIRTYKRVRLKAGPEKILSVFLFKDFPEEEVMYLLINGYKKYQGE